MAKIDIVSEVMKHDDHEIMEFLLEEISAVRTSYTKAYKENNSDYLYGVSRDIAIIWGVLKEIDRRNKERGLQ